jgi:putative Holliday junction resolvase
MAVDYGERRTGLAVSDMTASIAGEAWVVTAQSMAAAADTIAAEATTRGVTEIVLGYPKNMDGTLGERAKKSEQLADRLRERGDFTVTLWDERRTTIDAHRILSDNNRHGKKRKATIDAVAATLILEGYLQNRAR